MILIRTKIFESRPVGIPRDVWRKISRESMFEMAEYWHRHILPEHFTPAARHKYKHKPRSTAYEARKQKLAQRRGYPFGGNVDNVLSGDMMDMLSQIAIIRAFPTRVTLRMKGPRYMTMRVWKADQPDKAKEITTLTAAEEKLLAKVLGDAVKRRIRDYRQSKTITIQ